MRIKYLRETFTTDLLRNAEEVGFTVFHDAPLPPDDFIANCKVSLAELIEREEQPLHEEWVSAVIMALFRYASCTIIK